MGEKCDLEAARTELAKACDRYEAALVGNDVEVLLSLFWDSPETVRYGATENLYGADEIKAFRQGRSSSGLAREVLRREIVVLDAITGYSNLEFERSSLAGKRCGRQSQFWRKLPGQGWKVVSAHVSILASS